MSEDLPPPPGEFAAGSRVAGYRLEEQIGRGGMAVVFRALDERLERQVALKILSPALATDDAFRQRFIRESRAAAAVDDPHIIPVFEAGEAGGVLFIAMRYVRGGDVRTLVEAEGPLSPRRAMEMIDQVASALDAAHARGLVHRDVKPANMLLDSRAGTGRPDHVYLSDFGLSKASLAPSGLTGTGQFLGTLDYVSPEQIEGRLVDGRADQYGLACAAFEFFCGEPPFLREEGMAVMYAKLSEPPPALTARRPDLPPAVDAVFARALAKQQEDRFATCRDFAAALRAALGLRRYDSESVSQPAPRWPTEVVRQSPPAGFQWEAGAQPSGGIPTSAAERLPSAPPGRPASGSPGGAVPGPLGGMVTSGPQPGAGSYPQDDSRHGAPGQAGAGWDDGAAAPPTRAARRQPVSRTVGITGPTTGYQETGRSRSRSPVVLLITAVVVLALAAGGGAYYLLAGRSPGTHAATGGTGGTGGGKNSGHGGAAALALPACGTAVGQASNLHVGNSFVTLPDNPFGVQASADGRYVFTTVPGSLLVLRTGPGTTLTPQGGPGYPLAGGPKNMALASHGRYLLVASGNGITIFDVAQAEAGQSSAMLTTLSTPGVPAGHGGAIEIALSPDEKFAFVVLQYRDEMAVFNLQQALQTGSGSTAFVGTVPLGVGPVGLTRSPDGNWLYAMNSQLHKNNDPVGSISVIDLHAAEAHPNAAVVRTVKGVCEPGRAITSADGKVLWVTAKASNHLLGFDAARLRSDPAHALIAKVQVGATPIGLVFANGGRRIVVADTSISGIPPFNLAVVDTAAALKGKTALLGYIPSGQLPRQFGLVPGTKTLLVSDNGSNQIQTVNLANLP